MLHYQQTALPHGLCFTISRQHCPVAYASLSADSIAPWLMFHYQQTALPRGLCFTISRQHCPVVYASLSADSIAPWLMLHCTKTCVIHTMYAQCNMVTRSRNHCCHGNATTCSLCIVVDSQVAVSNLKPLSVAMETQWLPSAVLSGCKNISYCC